MKKSDDGFSDYRPDFTPVMHLEREGLWLKRDDLFCVAGVHGGKVRSCWRLAKDAKGLVTASSRHSPQMTIVARIAARKGIPARCHIAAGDETAEMLEAQAAGATLVPHRPGYNSVIIARAKADAGLRSWTDIPFGMKCAEAVEETAYQVHNLPPPNEIKRIMVPVGSGISFAGILDGLSRYRPDLDRLPVIGIVVGADPGKTLERLAPFGWAKRGSLRQAGVPYQQEIKDSRVGALEVDPHYEGKVLRFLQPGDLFWVVGVRRSQALKAAE